MSFLQQNLEALQEGLSTPGILEKAHPLFTGARRFERLQSRGHDYLLHEGHVIDCNEVDYWKRSYARRSSSVNKPKILVLVGPRMAFELQKILDTEKTLEFVFLMDLSAELLRETLDSLDLTAWAKRGRLAVEVVDHADRAFTAFYSWLRQPQRAFVMDAAWILIHPQILKTEREFADRIYDEWMAATKQIRRHFGEKEDSLLGFRQMIENRELIESSPGVVALKNQFRDWPAIIVSTGPSLTKSLDDLKRVSNKALLIAADASLPVLKRAGMEPHFVATLERDHVSQRFFDDDSFRSHLIAYAFIPGSNIRAFKGSHWLAYRDYGYMHFLEQIVPRGIISSSSSVAHFCMNLALWMGCREIVLVGQDLAYDPETFQSHASGVPFETWSQTSSLEAMKARLKEEGLGDLLFLPGNKGGEVPSHSVYFSFIKEFAWQASQSPVPIVNATDGGAQIPGIQWRPLSDVTKDWSRQEDLFARINQLYETAPREGSFSDLKNILPFFRDLSAKLKEIRLLSGPLLSPQINLAPEKLGEMAAALRLAQKELLRDSRFISFIVQNAGMEMVNIENAMAVSEASENGPQELLQLVDSWNALILSVSDAICRDLDSLAVVDMKKG